MIQKILIIIITLTCVVILAAGGYVIGDMLLKQSDFIRPGDILGYSILAPFIGAVAGLWLGFGLSDYFNLKL